MKTNPTMVNEKKKRILGKLQINSSCPSFSLRKIKELGYRSNTTQPKRRRGNQRPKNPRSPRPRSMVSKSEPYPPNAPQRTRSYLPRFPRVHPQPPPTLKKIIARPFHFAKKPKRASHPKTPFPKIFRLVSPTRKCQLCEHPIKAKGEKTFDSKNSKKKILICERGNHKRQKLHHKKVAKNELHSKIQATPFGVQIKGFGFPNFKIVIPKNKRRRGKNKKLGKGERAPPGILASLYPLHTASSSPGPPPLVAPKKARFWRGPSSASFHHAGGKRRSLPLHSWGTGGLARRKPMVAPQTPANNRHAGAIKPTHRPRVPQKIGPRHF